MGQERLLRFTCDVCGETKTFGNDQPSSLYKPPSNSEDWEKWAQFHNWQHVHWSVVEPGLQEPTAYTRTTCPDCSIDEIQRRGWKRQEYQPLDEMDF